MERADTILAFQGRAYRLARLIAGDARAPRLVARAFRRLSPADADPERALLAALLPAPALGWSVRPSAADLAAAGFAPDVWRRVRAALAAAAPAARAELGARYLLGAAPPAPSAPEPPSAAPWPRRPADGAALRACLARALGELPAGAQYSEVLDQVHLRAALLADGGAGDRARALRDAVVRSDDRLAAALPALFGGEAPPELTARLLREAAPRRPRLGGPARSARLQLGLVMAVALAVAAAVAMPRGRGAAAVPPAGDTGPALSPAELVERAIGRFETGAPASGVLHERYAAEVGGERWLVERWHGYEPPHPLRVEVRDEADRLRFALATDGAGRLQIRQARRGGGSAPLAGRDYELPADQIGAMLPILRQQPDGLLLFGGGRAYNLDQYYLARARSAALSDLGSGVVAGRPARLIGFRSAYPLPPRTMFDSGQPRDSAQIVLAIDGETFGLLEARVLAGSDEAGGVVRTPWRAEVHELRHAAGPASFALPPAADAPAADLIPGPRLTAGDDRSVISLAEAAARVGGTLYLPDAPDGPGIGYALENPFGAIVVREGVHDTLTMLQFSGGDEFFVEGERRPQQVGDREYTLVEPGGLAPTVPVSMATIYFSDDTAVGVHLIYAHAYATRGEREARLAEILRSLRPVDAAEAGALAGELAPASTQ